MLSKKMFIASLFGLSLPLMGYLQTARGDDAVTVAAQVPADARSPLYPCNRAPLVVTPLIKLPVGTIHPQGWLLGILKLEAAGMAGHLDEISPWLVFKGNAWTNPKGDGKNGGEEVPYWLRGYGDLGYVLHNQRIIKNTNRWLNAVLDTAQPDGFFGPAELRTSVKGKPDLWPNMPMLETLEHYYSFNHEKRILDVMTGYFHWELAVPDKDFMAGYWPLYRTGDNLQSVYWLYNRTGDPKLLQLAKKIERHTPNWITTVPNYHNVNFAQGFREPAEYWEQSKNPKYLAGTTHAFDEMMDKFGQVPGGGFSADENARPGYTDPRQGFETCGMVEYMYSFELLQTITGKADWADRCEDVAFNDLPAALTPDLKALHYLTSPNSIQLDQHNKSPDLGNGGTMISYSPGGVYRCCQHNHGMGWPFFAEHLWEATSDQGLCASIYSASSVTAKVKGETPVTIDETTKYPFDGSVNLHLTWDKTAPATVAFPLYLRVPKWCQNATVQIDGKELPVQSKPDTFIVINRTWSNGDKVSLNLPMAVSVHRWTKNKDSASVNYGPLTFSLDIGEKWKQYGNVNGWPEWDVYATTPWNYGLVLNSTDPTQGIEVIHKDGPVPSQPWTAAASPILLTMKAEQIPNWKKDHLNMVGTLQPSPVKGNGDVQTVKLIPMGAARLRISQFPVIGTGPNANQWQAPKPPLYHATASHSQSSDPLSAIDDSVSPTSGGSADGNIPRFTWWDHMGTTEWVQYDFDHARTLSSTKVYWFDDTSTNGKCRPPASWTLLYQDGNDWKPVKAKDAYGVATNQFNTTTFDSVKTKAVRLQVKLQRGFSGGILEWTVEK